MKTAQSFYDPIFGVTFLGIVLFISQNFPQEQKRKGRGKNFLDACGKYPRATKKEKARAVRRARH